MNKPEKISRRTFLSTKAPLLIGTLLVAPTAANALAETCGLTPEQAQGPFYPGDASFEQNTDLTQVPGRPTRAEGQVIYVKGRVLDATCTPIPNANVEIWQACASGKYNNRRDPNPAPLDPNFRYWAETFTDENGEYAFKTIIPGAYPAADGWVRPPHIHVKAAKLGHRDLITQMYFKGHALNEKDLILQDIPGPQRASVIVEFTPSPLDLEPGSQIGTFDITLQPITR